MSTGMRKWMEKDCPEIEHKPAQVLVDRGEIDRLRAERDEYKTNWFESLDLANEAGEWWQKLQAERDALRAELDSLKQWKEQIEGQEMKRSSEMRQIVIDHIKQSRWWKECDDCGLDQPDIDALSNRELFDLLMHIERLK